MSSPDGSPGESDRVAALEARLRTTRDQDRQDQLRVLLALEHLTQDFEKAEARLRAAEREIAERAAILEGYRDWRRDVDRDLKQLTDALARMDERYASRDELDRTYVARRQAARSYGEEAFPPIAKKALAVAGALVALALVLALGGGPFLQRLMGS